MAGCPIIADREYGKENFVKLVIKFSLCSCFFMPDNVYRCHLFGGRSYLKQNQDQIEEEAKNDRNVRIDTVQCDPVMGTENFY